jgi:molybdate transport system substrate-binding protein
MKRLLAALLLPFAFAGAALSQPAAEKVANAPPGSVRLLVSTGLKASLEAVRADAEKAAGHPLVIEYGASKALRAQIEGGQVFEVTVLTPDVINDMAAKGRIVAGSATTIGHVAVAVAVKGDAAPHGDVGDPAALKALLLGARTVRYLGIGASAPTVQHIFDGLGIADALKERISTATASQAAPPMAGAGEYEVLINLNSELHPVNGWAILGLAPAQFQVPVTETAAIGVGGDAAAAQAVIKFLLSPAYESALKASGMTR